MCVCVCACSPFSIYSYHLSINHICKLHTQNNFEFNIKNQYDNQNREKGKDKRCSNRGTVRTEASHHGSTLLYLSSTLKPGLHFFISAGQGMYASVIWGWLHSCCIYICANVTFWLVALKQQSTEQEVGLTNQPAGCVPPQPTVGIWEVCVLACLQQSAAYAYPSTPLQHRYPAMPTYNCG